MMDATQVSASNGTKDDVFQQSQHGPFSKVTKTS